MYVNAPHACRAHGGKKRTLYLQELELQAFVSCRVGAET